MCSGHYGLCEQWAETTMAMASICEFSMNIKSHGDRDDE